MHWSCQTLNKEGVYTGTKNAIMSGFYAHCSVETNFYCFYVPRNTWKWYTSTMKQYKPVTHMVECIYIKQQLHTVFHAFKTA